MGLPEILVTDNGKQLVGEITAAYVKKMKIKHVKTPINSPESNGLPERFNQELKRKIWEADYLDVGIQKYLQEFVTEYRNTPHRSIGMTPFEKMFRRKKRDHLAVDAEDEVTADVEVGRELAARKKKNIEKINERRGAGQHTLKVGDLVRIKMMNNELTEPQRIRDVLNKAVRLEDGRVWPLRRVDKWNFPEERSEGGNVVRV